MSKSFVEYLEMQCEPKKIRTEEEILKDFEKLGYKIIENNPNWLELSLEDENLRIEIFKADMTYTFDDYLDMQEHKLLHELFLCWAWI